VHHYNSTQYCKTERVFSIFPFLQTNITSQMWPCGGNGGLSNKLQSSSNYCCKVNPVCGRARSIDVHLQISLYACTSESKTTTKWQHKPTQQLLNTTNICKTKPNETKSWFRSPFTPSSQKTDWAYSTAHEACMENGMRVTCEDMWNVKYSTDLMC